MKKQLLILTVALFIVSCTTPIDVTKETVIQNAKVQIEKEHTEQLHYQWKIDSLKEVNKCK